MNIKDIQKLAALSRINLPETEKESLLKEMDSILAYVDQVKEASSFAKASEDKAAKKPSLRNVFRADGEPHPSGLFTEKLLASAPDRHNDYIKVKKVL